MVDNIEYHHTPPAEFYDIDVDAELAVLSGLIMVGG